jgi:hypothetical protein
MSLFWKFTDMLHCISHNEIQNDQNKKKTKKKPQDVLQLLSLLSKFKIKYRERLIILSKQFSSILLTYFF